MSEKSKRILMHCIIAISVFIAVMVAMSFIQWSFNKSVVNSMEDFAEFIIEDKREAYLNRIANYNNWSLPKEFMTLWLSLAAAFFVVDVALIVIYLINRKKSGLATAGGGSAAANKKQRILTLCVTVLSALVISIAIVSSAQSLQCNDLIIDTAPGYWNVIDETDGRYRRLINMVSDVPNQYSGAGMTISNTLLFVDIGAAIWLVCDVKKNKKQSRQSAETK